MEFRTIVEIGAAPFRIEPLDEMLFVGSCFADAMGRRFCQDHFRAVVNPHGTMYNPISVLHSVERVLGERPHFRPRVTFLTLGTNHVYRLRSTGEVVDNCAKRPASLFREELLGVAECVAPLRQAVALLRERRPDAHVAVTVSPIRYRKYGYHESQLSKAVLLLATAQLAEATYFPAYELVMDELRDYRFYQPDMLHPSDQAVDYLWERLVEAWFSERARQFLHEWMPLKAALGHKPFHPESPEWQRFASEARSREAALLEKYGLDTHGNL